MSIFKSLYLVLSYGIESLIPTTGKFNSHNYTLLDKNLLHLENNLHHHLHLYLQLQLAYDLFFEPFYHTRQIYTTTCTIWFLCYYMKNFHFSLASFLKLNSIIQSNHYIYLNISKMNHLLL